MPRTRKPWRSEETEWLRAFHKTCTVAQLAGHLGRPDNSISQRLHRLGLSVTLVTAKRYHGKLVPVRKWTDDEKSTLKREGPAHTCREMAAMLNRSRDSVWEMAKTLGVQLQLSKRRWTKKELYELMVLSETLSVPEIAKRMNRTIESVSYKVSAEGIRLFGGHYSLNQAAETTGYAVPQLMRARDALGLKWRKAKHSNHGRFVISHEQLEQMTDYLRTEPRNVGDNAVKLWALIDRSGGEDACWPKKSLSYLWTDPHKPSVHMVAIRAVWHLVHGEFPPEKVRLLSTCGNRYCMNLKHRRWVQTKPMPVTDRRHDRPKKGEAA